MANLDFTFIFLIPIFMLQGANLLLKDPVLPSVDTLVDVSAIKTDPQTDPLTFSDPNGLTRSQARLFTDLKRFEGIIGQVSNRNTNFKSSQFNL